VCYLACLAEGGSIGVAVVANLGTMVSRRATVNLGTRATAAQTLAFSVEGGSSGVADSLWQAGDDGGSHGKMAEDGRETRSCGDGAGEQHARQVATMSWVFGPILLTT
jgi:hypothetical protein